MTHAVTDGFKVDDNRWVVSGKGYFLAAAGAVLGQVQFQREGSLLQLRPLVFS